MVRLSDWCDWVVGGWDPSWDKHKKFHLIKPLKGHIRERTREAR